MRASLQRHLRLLQRLFVYRPIATLLVGLVGFYIWATIAVMVEEGMAFGQAASLIMPAFFGELGQVECSSVVTRVSVLVALVSSVAFLAVLTAGVTSKFVEFCRTGGSIVNRVAASGHIIICGWSSQGEGVVEELLASSMRPPRDIVILADLDQRPVKDVRIEFVRGDPTQDDDLTRVGAKDADSVIVLSDTSKPVNEADAEALMIVLAVESLNRDIHSTVQILNSDNRVHFERAHADEIICLDQMGGNFLVASAINHGVSTVVSELLTFDKGSEFYRYDRRLSDRLVGKEFAEAAQELSKQRVVLLGFETDYSDELKQALPDDIVHSVADGRRMIVVNPQGSYSLRQGDALFVISEAEPTEL
jgi:voltage-gated potassium channel